MSEIFQVLLWVGIALTVLPLLVYLVAKMATLGVLRAKEGERRKPWRVGRKRREELSEEDLN